MDIKWIISLLILSITIFLIFKTYFYQKNKKLLKLKEINKSLEQLESELSNQIKEKEQLTNTIIQQTGELEKLKIEKNSLSNNIQDLRQQAQDAADIFYQQTMELANTRIEKDIDLEEQKFQKAKENYKKEYEKVLAEFGEEISKLVEQQKLTLSANEEEINAAAAKLADLKNKMSIIIESNRIAELESSKKDFYRCVISEADISEISKLRAIETYFRNPRPICKIIWESYYKDSFSTLLSRILPEKTPVSGIYKITNLADGKIYIGQSVNLAERLRNHIKAGVGIDAPGLKLYVDMKKLGVENFSFEILEKCPALELNNKEKYWIEFYHSQDFGYNITKGGSQKITS